VGNEGGRQLKMKRGRKAERKEREGEGKAGEKEGSSIKSNKWRSVHTFVIHDISN
jgi:hypothetical protein